MIRRWGRAVAALGGTAVAIAVLVPQTAGATPEETPPPPGMQVLVDDLKNDMGSPGAALLAGDEDGDWYVTSGTAELGQNRPIQSTDRMRVASNTKMYVASTLLLLEADGLVDLDATVEAYLPGLVRYPNNGADYDGRTITLRQLLSHTSGMQDFTDEVYVFSPVRQLYTPLPQDNIAHATSKGPKFAPGAIDPRTGEPQVLYSNAGYNVLGLVIEKVTGKKVSQVIDERIVDPLGLQDTYFAERHERAIVGTHVHGYLTLADVTLYDPGVWYTAGAMVSSAEDMVTFLEALLGGEILTPAQLAEMQTTNAAPDLGAGVEYGLGLVRVPVPCPNGTTIMAWGHSGHLMGYQTFTLVTDDGRHGFVISNDTPVVAAILGWILGAIGIDPGFTTTHSAIYKGLCAT